MPYCNPVGIQSHRRILLGGLDALAGGDGLRLLEALIELHYDPAYNRSRRKVGREPMAQIALACLGEASLADAADRIARLVEGLRK